VWVDPIVATGYDFVVYSGPEMVSVEIPTGYGDDVFDLYLHDGTDWYDTNIDIDAGVSYTFQSPVDRMSIRGIETYEMLDPSDPTAFVTGITYASNGTILMTMTPVTTNYALPACGSDPSLTDLMIWTDLQTYQPGSTAYADYYVNCSVNTKDYELHAFAYSTSGTSWSDYQEWNWTETDSYEAMNDSRRYWNLNATTYCINATLYMVSGTAYQFVDFEVTCFTVTGNNSGDNNTGDGDFTECTPWNNVECNDEFGCSAGERIPILAIDESGEIMLDSDGNQIEVWGCSETSSGEGEGEASEIPSIGVLGTLVAICVSFVAVNNREQEE
jgi:hypothetical protein